jgi:hypothetical protein
VDREVERVAMAADGDAAMRALWRIARGRGVPIDLDDRLDPVHSSARAAWMVLRPDEVLTAEWVPAPPFSDGPATMTLDPAV